MVATATVKRLPERLRSWHGRYAAQLWVSALLLALLFVYLLPDIVVTVPAGHTGVLWRRFGLHGLSGIEPGTETDRSYGEGIHFILPWNQMTIYDTRIQKVTRTFAALMNNGLRVQVEVSIRFRPLEGELGSLQKYVGPDYIEVLIVSELGARVREELSKLTPDELYTRRREELSELIYRKLMDEFAVHFDPVRALFGPDAHLRRRILEILVTANAPMSAEQIAHQLRIVPVAAISSDLENLVRARLVEGYGQNGFTWYRANSKRLANSLHFSDLLSRGKPLVHIEDVLVQDIELPAPITAAINEKLVAEQRLLEYDFQIAREQKERERKRIEAEGIRAFQDIVAEGISERYLKWKGIEATLELAASPNSKVVVIGSASDGLPLILGPLESQPASAAVAARARPTPAAGTASTNIPVVPSPSARPPG